MDSRTGNIQYRSVPLIQRGDMARIGAEAAARRANDAAEREESHRRRNRDLDCDEDVERTLPRRRPTASPRGSMWERSASEFEAVPQPPREHVSAYLDESSVVRVTRRSERSHSYRASDAFADDRYREDRFAPRSQRLTLVEDDDRFDAPHSTPLRGRASDSWQSAGVSLAYDRHYEDDYDYDERPGLVSRIWQGLRAVVGLVIAIPRAIVSGLVSAVQHVHLRGLIVLGAIALAGLMLYGPVRDLYLASRRLDTLQATYDILVEENNQIREELELLQTRDGIENEARARGYVEPGETKVVVEGLPQEEDPATAYMIEDIELPDDRAWYIRMLDDLFGYNPEA